MPFAIVPEKFSTNGTVLSTRKRKTDSVVNQTARHLPSSAETHASFRGLSVQQERVNMHGRPQQPQREATRGMPGNKRLEKHQLDLSRLLHIQAETDSAVSCTRLSTDLLALGATPISVRIRMTAASKTTAKS